MSHVGIDPKPNDGDLMLFLPSKVRAMCLCEDGVLEMEFLDPEEASPDQVGMNESPGWMQLWPCPILRKLSGRR